MAIENTNRKAYNATAELAFEYNGQRTNIEQEKIAYILVEHDYDKQTLPIIYISLSANDVLYNNILNYKDSAKFYLKLSKTNKNSSVAITQDTLEGSFNYVTSSTNPNFREDLSKSDNTILDSSFRRIMVGLVSIELTNSLRKSFNGVMKNIDQKTLLGKAIEGTNCVIENPTYNEQFDSIAIPPITSRFKFIEYIFSKNNFYDTNFRYFMDFKRSYLLSKCGNYIDAGDGDLSTVIIDVKEVTANEAYYDGMEIKSGAYYIYINPSESNVTLNQSTEKVANQIVSVDETAEMQKLNLTINTTEGSTDKQLYIRTDNAALYKNELEIDSIFLEVLKHNVDGTHFTPNKIIMVKNYGDYQKYDGKYIISSKKEFYKCTAGEFYLSTTLKLRKIGNITPAKSESNSKSSGYGSNTATKTSSANKRKK